jgi:hypothetical protein
MNGHDRVRQAKEDRCTSNEQTIQGLPWQAMFESCIAPSNIIPSIPGFVCQKLGQDFPYGQQKSNSSS